MADKVVIQCEKCGRQFQISTDMIGKKVRCPCGNITSVREGVPPEDTARKWYYAKSGERFGPVAVGDLRQLARDSLLTKEDFVWVQGMESWEPAGAVPEVSGIFASPEEAAQPPAAEPEPGPAVEERELPSEAPTVGSGQTAVAEPESAPETAVAQPAVKTPAREAAPARAAAKAPARETAAAPADTQPAAAEQADTVQGEDIPTGEHDVHEEAAPSPRTRAGRRLKGGAAGPSPAGAPSARWVRFLARSLDVLAIVVAIVYVATGVMVGLVTMAAAPEAGGRVAAAGGLLAASSILTGFVAFVVCRSVALILRTLMAMTRE